MNPMFALWAALLANLIAQLLKPVFLYMRTKKFDIHQTIACGGFPSSHSSTVAALTSAVAIIEGIESTLFAVTCIFSFIVIYDAVNVRYYAGKNIQLTKQLISDLETMSKLHFSDPIYQEKLKSVLGHRLVEAVGGCILGILVTTVLYFIIHR
ncbi:MAG: divergent PAP2 family protein [Erysipelotrichaceae bacterium]|nr:divergent PAP2 family protein [Erysipelotrichaceae bacterium]